MGWFSSTPPADQGTCAACGNKLAALFLNGSGGRRYCSERCYKAQNVQQVERARSQRELDYIDQFAERFAGCETDEDWRRVSGGWSQTTMMEDAHKEVMRIRQEEEREFRETLEEDKRSAATKLEAEQAKRQMQWDKDDAKFKASIDKANRENERVVNKLMEENRRKQEKLRKEQEIEEARQAEEQRWAPRPFKP